MARTVGGSNGPTSSRVFTHASTRGAGNRLGDEAMSWPSFTKVGPSTSNPSTSPTDAACTAVRPWRRRSQWATARITDVASTKQITNDRRSSARPNRSSGGGCTARASGGGPSA
jgi:hypothetical protein